MKTRVQSFDSKTTIISPMDCWSGQREYYDISNFLLSYFLPRCFSFLGFWGFCVAVVSFSLLNSFLCSAFTWAESWLTCPTLVVFVEYLRSCSIYMTENALCRLYWVSSVARVMHPFRKFRQICPDNQIQIQSCKFGRIFLCRSKIWMKKLWPCLDLFWVGQDFC